MPAKLALRGRACLSGDVAVAAPVSRPTGYPAQHTCHKALPSDLTCVEKEGQEKKPSMGNDGSWTG